MILILAGAILGGIRQQTEFLAKNGVEVPYDFEFELQLETQNRLSGGRKAELSLRLQELREEAEANREFR